MILEGQGEVGALQDRLVSEMDAIEEADRDRHAKAFATGRTQEEKSSSSVVSNLS